jgi:hypothetical protein
MRTNPKAEQIADKYLPQIRFTHAYFYDSDTSPFPACLHLEIPTKMLMEYASLKNKGEIPKDHDGEREFLTGFWKETGLAKRLMTHKDANIIPEQGRESPMDMLEYLTGEDVYVLFSTIHAKRDLQGEKVEINVLDMPPQDEDESA